MVMHTCNPTTWEVEAGGSCIIQGQPELHGETLSQMKQDKNKDKRITRGLL
jgi:hypothetical protein